MRYGHSERGVVMNEQSKVGFSFDARKYMMVIALVGIWVIFEAISAGTYLTPRNLSNLFRQSVFTAILAIGMFNIIVLGHIDLSVGSLAGLCGGILAIANVWKGISPGMAILLTLAIGLLLGMWNGWWVAYRNVPSFIVTLAGLLVFRGVLVGITDGITIAPLSPFFGMIGQDFLPSIVGYGLGAVVVIIFLIMQYSERGAKNRHGLQIPAARSEIMKSVLFFLLILAFVVVMNAYQGIPNPVVIVLVLFFVFNYVTNKTVFGRRVYAIGGNKMASRLAGINIKRTTLIVFALMGVMAAIAGIFLTSRLDAAAVNAATSAELDAIAACVIGGTSLMGGVGTVSGAVIGAVVMASLDNGMSLLNAPSFYQTIVKGLVLLLAVWFDMSRKKGEND
jgi:D-xylose transport system permease protein